MDVISESLNERQKLFCLLFTSDKECFGNASKSYRTAYNLSPAQYKAGEVSAHHLLRNPKLQDYINELLDQTFKDKSVDRETAKIIKQDKDLVSKGMMIKEYNKLKKRVSDQPLVTIKIPKPILSTITEAPKK
jgi:tRNA(Met) C34 N-acetyltransferase TmcA